jgi:hypothetical protein
MKLPIATASVLLGCLLTVVQTDVSAPNPQELHKLYEPTMERFVVHSGITLTVEYGPDGRACQFLIAPKQALVELQSPIPPMSSESVSELLRQLLPIAMTGKQINSTAAQVNEAKTLLTTDYENVSVRRICSSPSCISSNENQDLRTVVVFKRDTCPKHVE